MYKICVETPESITELPETYKSRKEATLALKAIVDEMAISMSLDDMAELYVAKVTDHE
jgi:uncharacterized SAM-dependent methyltransferase